jgi:hypothetical protein
MTAPATILTPKSHPIRGVFVIPRRAPIFWRLAGQHWHFRFMFPGAFMAYNRSPRRKRP